MPNPPPSPSSSKSTPSVPSGYIDPKTDPDRPSLATAVLLGRTPTLPPHQTPSTHPKPPPSVPTFPGLQESATQSSSPLHPQPPATETLRPSEVPPKRENSNLSSSITGSISTGVSIATRLNPIPKLETPLVHSRAETSPHHPPRGRESGESTELKQSAQALRDPINTSPLTGTLLTSPYRGEPTSSSSSGGRKSEATRPFTFSPIIRASQDGTRSQSVQSSLLRNILSN